MKQARILEYLKTHRFFFIFILIFSYLQSIYSRILLWNRIDKYIFTPEAALASLFDASILFLYLFYLVKKQRSNRILKFKDLLLILLISLVLYILTMQVIGLVIALIFDNFEKNFNPQTLTLNLISNILNGFIYGSFFLTYYYFRTAQKNQIIIQNSEKALAESRINQLKNQLNPHFLFNNLNILDQLIEENKEKASEFLIEFAEIYRYILKVSDLKTVPMHEEIQFAKQYFNLLLHRFGLTYTIDWKLPYDLENRQEALIPLSLQILIENAIKHNFGTVEQPIHIEIHISDGHVWVKNNKTSSSGNTHGNGKALLNLQEQMQMLSHKKIEIESTKDYFQVQIPILEL